MARIRSLKPDFFKDEDLGALPFWVRLLYEGLWLFADREGRLENRPIKLKAEIFPYDKVDVSKGLKLLSQPKVFNPKKTPFIICYENNGDNYIQILNFRKHQTPHYTEKESTIPAPNEVDSKTTPKVLQEPSGASQDAPEQETISLTHISFQKEGEWGGIQPEDIEAWAKAYPACDVPRELSAMAEWIKANPAKGKKANYRRFIVNWLARSQERGGGMKSNPRRSVDDAVARERRIGASNSPRAVPERYWQAAARLLADRYWARCDEKFRAAKGAEKDAIERGCGSELAKYLDALEAKYRGVPREKIPAEPEKLLEGVSI
jgi:hypothetical protein